MTLHAWGPAFDHAERAAASFTSRKDDGILLPWQNGAGVRVP
jgi:hypothetical protein